MKDIIKIIKLDILSIRPYFTIKNLVILIGMGLFYSLFSKNIYAGYGVTLIFSILFCSYPFLVGEESGIDVLYTAFGIKREKVVLGRYLWSNLIIFMSLVIGSNFTVINSLLLERSTRINDLLFLILIYFILNSTIILIQYPFYFKYGYTKAKTVITSVFLILGILTFILIYFQDTLKKVIGFEFQNPYLIVVIILLLWICFYTISIKSSINIYKNRDLV